MGSVSINKAQGLSVFALVMLISGAIDSIRNLPAVAMFGSSLIFFFIFAAIAFLIPAALVSAELSSSWTEKSGIFAWTELAFGKKIAFLAIWLQWINTMVWYPTILSFIAGTAVFLIDPALIHSKVYFISTILGVFWLLTLLNLKGIKVSSTFASFCAVAGMIIPMVFIIGFAGFWVFMGEPMQLHFSVSQLLPSFSHAHNWISLTAIMTAFLGMELATVHVKNVRNPQKNFPKAMLYSVLIITITMVLGSLAVGIIVPHDQINLVEGVMQMASHFFHVYHIEWLVPVLATMLVVGSLGGMINWMISPAKGLLQAAEHGFLPTFFQKENKHGVASNLLIIQGLVVSVVCLVFLLMPGVNGSYWLLTDLSTQLYMLMYVIMFLAALVIRYKYPRKQGSFRIPGGKLGIWAVSMLGLLGCSITVVVGFFPPGGIDVGGFWHYELLFGGGIVVMLLPVLFFYRYRSRSAAQ